MQAALLYGSSCTILSLVLLNVENLSDTSKPGETQGRKAKGPVLT